MTNTTDRHFLVAKVGERSGNPIVIVREVAAGSCAYTFSREQAWAHATMLAQPRKQGNKRIHGLLNIHFTGLDMMTTDLGPAKSNEDIPSPTLDKQEDKCNTTPMTNSAPSTAQTALFNKLCTELGQFNDPTYTYTAGFAAGVDRKAASAAISAAIDLVKQTKAQQPQQAQEAPREAGKVAAGHYAVEDNEGTLRFFRVDCPTKGKWAGYTFLKLQASDDYYPVKDAGKRTRIIEAIARDPQGAMLRYGREIGKCGHCNRTLTDEQSRQDGIGPVCKGNLGW